MPHSLADLAWSLVAAAVVALILWTIAVIAEGPRKCGLCNGDGWGTNDVGEPVRCPLCTKGKL